MTAATRTPQEWKALRQKLAVWYGLSKHERLMANEPLTVSAWADRYGVSRKWTNDAKKHPDFLDAQGVVQTQRLTNRLDPGVLPAGISVSDDATNAELFGEVVRAQLVAATQGDPKALDFIKTANISKPFIDALTAEFEESFPDKSDQELVEMFLDSFPDLVIECLRARGYEVTREAAAD